MALVTKSLGSPLTFVWPGDPAIDQDAWGPEAAAEYMTTLIRADRSLPFPPEKPGEKATRITMAPLNYDAYTHAMHMEKASTYPDGLDDPEVQRHVLRHALVDLEGAYHEDEDGKNHPIRTEMDHGPFGRRISDGCWSDYIGPFLDPAVRQALAWWSVQFSVERLLRSRK